MKRVTLISIFVGLLLSLPQTVISQDALMSKAAASLATLLPTAGLRATYHGTSAKSEFSIVPNEPGNCREGTYFISMLEDGSYRIAAQIADYYILYVRDLRQPIFKVQNPDGAVRSYDEDELMTVVNADGSPYANVKAVLLPAIDRVIQLANATQEAMDESPEQALSILKKIYEDCATLPEK